MCLLLKPMIKYLRRVSTDETTTNMKHVVNLNRKLFSAYLNLSFELTYCLKAEFSKCFMFLSVAEVSRNSDKRSRNIGESKGESCLHWVKGKGNFGGNLTLSKVKIPGITLLFPRSMPLRRFIKVLNLSADKYFL